MHLEASKRGVVHERRDIVLLHRLAVGCPHPTSTTAAIVVSRRCFICLNPCSRSSSIGVNPLLGIIVPNHSVFRVDQMIGWSPHCNLINVAIDEQHVADEISRMMHLSADKILGFTIYKIVGIN